jgi:hypothetical protein
MRRLWCSLLSRFYPPTDVDLDQMLQGSILQFGQTSEKSEVVDSPISAVQIRGLKCSFRGDGIEERS